MPPVKWQQSWWLNAMHDKNSNQTNELGDPSLPGQKSQNRTVPKWLKKKNIFAQPSHNTKLQQHIFSIYIYYQ